jgi:hypothetical protein
MEKQGQEIHVDEVEASAGETSGRVRWILAIGTILAIVLLTIIWVSGALSQGDIEEEATATGIIESTDDGNGSLMDEVATDIPSAPEDDTPVESDGLEVIPNE